MAMLIDKIDHLVVLMMENRSFDNLAGYLYKDKPLPLHFEPSTNKTPYQGLSTGGPYWNPMNASYYSGQPAQPIYVKEGASGPTVPDPDPGEYFDDMNYQLFGVVGVTHPAKYPMSGFYLNYKNQKSKPTAPEQIMQCFSSHQVPAMSLLARSYAISDAWHASTPNQTWPNRAFAALGTSLGKVNNWPYDPYHYDVKTIFNTLENTGHTWNVYNDSDAMSLTRLQFPKLYDLFLEGHFHGFKKFQKDAANGNLPQYSFVEPRFIGHEANDMHPPHNVPLGDKYIYEVTKAVMLGKKAKNTLVIITFDEHGGCYDHLMPPFGAVTPGPESNPGEEGFTFNRFGVRIPTLFISPLIKPSTVFRSPTDVPYDHTSILASLQEWLKLPTSEMPVSARTQKAPTFWNVLNNPSADTNFTPLSEYEEGEIDVMKIKAPSVKPGGPANDLQLSMVVAAASAEKGSSLTADELKELCSKNWTRKAVEDYLKK